MLVSLWSGRLVVPAWPFLVRAIRLRPSAGWRPSNTIMRPTVVTAVCVLGWMRSSSSATVSCLDRHHALSDHPVSTPDQQKMPGTSRRMQERPRAPDLEKEGRRVVVTTRPSKVQNSGRASKIPPTRPGQGRTFQPRRSSRCPTRRANRSRNPSDGRQPCQALNAGPIRAHRPAPVFRILWRR